MRCLLATIVTLLLLGGIANAQKKAVPSAAELETANQELSDLYKQDLVAAKKISAKIKIAEKFIALAGETNDDPPSKYALLLAARNVAAQCGNIDLALAAIQELDKHFDIDAASMEVDAISKMADVAKIPAEHFMVTRYADRAYQRFMNEGKYGAASPLTEMVIASARKAKDLDAVAIWTERQTDLGTAASDAAQVKQHEETLKTSVADPAANLAVGKVKAFLRQDWGQGLPMLALGSDKELAALAERELRMPNDAAARLAIADEWFAWGNKQVGHIKVGALKHAALLYRAQLPTLKGLSRTKIENRLADIGGEASPLDRKLWVEVLDLVQLAKDTGEGRWEQEGPALTAKQGGLNDVLLLPVEVTGNYEVRIVAVNLIKEFKIGLPDPAARCTLVINGWDGKFTGIELIGGKGGSENTSRTPGFANPPDKLTMIHLKVEHVGENVTIEAKLDGRRYFQWKGPSAALSNPNPRGDNRLVLAVERAPLTLLSVQVKSNKGTAKLTR